MNKLKAFVMPWQQPYEMVSDQRTRELIEESFDTDYNHLDRNMTMDELSQIIGNYEVILTSWGSPVINEDILAKAIRLKYVGHAAGTMKNRIPYEAFGRGVRVFSAAGRIAQSVAEYCMATMMACLRRLPQNDAALRSGKWKQNDFKGFELIGQRVGIVSLSSTARAFIKLLKPFQCEILVYDPYMKEETAAEFGVKSASLEDIMSCPVVSVHAPNLSATQGMISAEMLRKLPDGAVFVNSSRGAVIDEKALVNELSNGRFIAALDVFSKEPLPLDSPLVKMDNVILTPHVAGATVQGHHALMGCVVNDILKAMQGRQTCYEINSAQWEILA